MAEKQVKQFTYKVSQNLDTITIEIYADNIFIRSKDYSGITYTQETAKKDAIFEAETFGILDAQFNLYKLTPPPPPSTTPLNNPSVSQLPPPSSPQPLLLKNEGNLRIPKNKIQEKKYTSGGEYIIEKTNVEYKGYYYEFNNDLYTGESFSTTSLKLIPIQKRNKLLSNPKTAKYGILSGINLSQIAIASITFIGKIPA
jgi:hypothetical protein